MKRGGGGGRGHPYDRAPELVLRDVLEGYVSVESAARDYGVVIREGAMDAVATAQRRRERPTAGAFHRTEYVDALA